MSHNGKNLRKFRLICQVKDCPGASSLARVLTSHEESNKHVSNLTVGNRLSTAVFLFEEGTYHIRFLTEIMRTKGTRLTSGTHIKIPRLPAFLDDVDIEFTHLFMSAVTSPGVLHRQIREKEVNRSEASIEIVKQLGKGFVQAAPDMFPLQCPRSSEDSNFSHHLRDIEGAPFINIVRLVHLEGRVVIDKFFNLVFNHANIGA